jgi:hypothetical protein
MKNSKGATTKETLDTSVEEIKEYLREQISKWTFILNEDYKTDSGNRLELHSSGRLEGAINALSFIERLEKKNDE